MFLTTLSSVVAVNTTTYNVITSFIPGIQNNVYGQTIVIGNSAFTSNNIYRTVYAYDTSSYTALTSYSGFSSGIWSLAAPSSGYNTIYVAEGGTNTVQSVNTSTGKISSYNLNLSAAFTPASIWQYTFVVTPDNTKVYTQASYTDGGLNNRSGIYAINLQNSAAITLYERTGGGTIISNLTLSTDGTKLYATDTPLNLLRIFSTATNQQIATVSLSAPGQMAYTIPAKAYNVSYLLVGGGGSGVSNYTSSGGAGGVLYGTTSLVKNTVYTITVGTGGAGGILNYVNGNSGGNSSAFNLVAYGGGGGGTGGAPGLSGGSGGGAGSYGSLVSGGLGIVGQGNNGGSSSPPFGNGGAGGGAGSAANATTPGIGIINPISGSTVGQLSAGNYWIGGGGGGGLGGGGASGVSGLANTGGGGGGASYNVSAGGGGSGVVILSVPTVSYSGITTGSPAITANGSNTLITFLSSGSYTA